MNVPLHIRRIGKTTMPAGDPLNPIPTKGTQSRRVAGQMNRTEKAYAEHLDVMLRAGDIQWWAFESVKLRLASDTHYTPDFMVISRLGQFQFHEVKGFWRDDARVKIKVAADRYPMQFIAVKKVRDGWEREYIASPFTLALAGRGKEQR